MARNGKIARLPRAVRDELNRRMDDGEGGGRLLAWLNGLPAVSEVVAREFGGQAVSRQNLHEWKAGGFREWEVRRDMLEQTKELAANAEELNAATSGRLTDHLATMLAAHYATAVTDWGGGELTEAMRAKLRTLRAVCQDIVELRRGDHSGARLELERRRLADEREKTDQELAELFKRWAKNPDMRDAICKSWQSPEELERRIAEMLETSSETGGGGGEPAASGEGPCGCQTVSNPVKP